MASNQEGHLDQITPPHYQKENGVETIDYILAVCKDIEGDEAVCVGNIIRYISRYRQKTKTPETDIKKAQWYLSKLLEIVSKKSSKSETSINYDYPSDVEPDFMRGTQGQ